VVIIGLIIGFELLGLDLSSMLAAGMRSALASKMACS